MKGSVLATFIGLTAGYVILNLGVFALLLVELTRIFDGAVETRMMLFVFYLGVLLAIPLFFLWPVISLVIVWPSRLLLKSCGATSRAFVAFGGAVGALLAGGFFIGTEVGWEIYRLVRSDLVGFLLLSLSIGAAGVSGATTGFHLARSEERRRRVQKTADAQKSETLRSKVITGS